MIYFRGLLSLPPSTLKPFLLRLAVQCRESWGLSSQIPRQKTSSNAPPRHSPGQQAFYGINLQDRNSKESGQESVLRLRQLYFSHL